MKSEDLLKRYAQGVAYLAEYDVATSLEELAEQLVTVIYNLDKAGITFDDLPRAVVYLEDADACSDGAERNALIKRADRFLKYLPDLLEDYKLMIGE